MILVFLGGMIGAVSRFSISEIITSNEIGTWLVNLIGSFLLVFLYFSYNEGAITDATFLFWGIGFSGAFTTFSTINNQLFESLLQKEYKQALLLGLATYLIIILSVFIFYYFLNLVF